MSKEVKSACLPCVLPTALVTTNPGVKCIQDVVVGDRVLDASGYYSKVTKVWKREYDGDLITVTLPYQKEKVVLTPNHLILAVKGHKCRNSGAGKLCFPKDNPRCNTCAYKRTYKPEFVSADKLSTTGVRCQWVKHMLLLPRLKIIEDVVEIKVSEVANIGFESFEGGWIKPRKKNAHNRGRSAVAVKNRVMVNNDFMALAGFYLSEGSVTFGIRGAQTRFDFSKNEANYALETKQLLLSLFGVNASVSPNTESTIRVCIASMLIAHFFINLFGKGALNKHIPQWILTLPISKQKILIEKYWNGDGSQWTNDSETQTSLSATTVSRSLAYSLRLILHRLGIIHSFGKYKRSDHMMDGRLIKSNGYSYQIQVYPPSAIKLAEMIGYPIPKNWQFLQSHQAGIDENWLYLPVKKVKRKPYKGTVMNLTTEPNNTYIVDGIAVHNCGIGHFSTSSALLNEAMRFKKDGLATPQVLDDIAQAIGEQNALERIDLTPAKIDLLPDWEKIMANEALEKSRELRHRLESVQNMDELTQIAVETEEYYKYLNREWSSKRLKDCPTCQINTDAEIEEPEKEVKVKVETPKSKLSEYGRKSSEDRQKLLEEIHQARNLKN